MWVGCGDLGTQLLKVCVWVRGKCTTSSTTSMAGRLEFRAEIPRLRQRVRSCFASSWRSSGRLGSTPAPPCTAIAHPPILSLSLSLSLSLCPTLSLCGFLRLQWAKGVQSGFYRQPRTWNFMCWNWILDSPLRRVWFWGSPPDL